MPTSSDVRVFAQLAAAWLAVDTTRERNYRANYLANLLTEIATGATSIQHGSRILKAQAHHDRRKTEHARP